MVSVGEPEIGWKIVLCLNQFLVSFVCQLSASFLAFFGTTTVAFPSSILPCIPNSRRTLLNAVILCRVFLGMRSLICPFVLAMRSLITVDKNTSYVGYAMFSLAVLPYVKISTWCEVMSGSKNTALLPILVFKFTIVVCVVKRGR